MPLIITVSSSFPDLVIENWILQNPWIIEAKDTATEDVFNNILKFSALDK